MAAGDDVIPFELSAPHALQIIREMAADSDKIVILPHCYKRAGDHHITRPQIEACVHRGTISEGPFRNEHGNWQVTLYRHAGGEELSCVVAIEWAMRLLVITTYPERRR